MSSRLIRFLAFSAVCDNHFACRLRVYVIPVVVGLLVAGCAGQLAYREGKTLAKEGKNEAALAKFQEAVNHDPRDPEYRAAYIQTRDRAVTQYVNQADRLLQDGKTSDAEKSYQHALLIDPYFDRARAGLRAIAADRRHMLLLKDAEAAWGKKDSDTAQAKLRTILAENPYQSGALKLKQTIQEKTVSQPVESSLSTAYQKPITIEFKDVAVKQVFEVISRTSGLNFLFDKDVKTDQKTSIFLKNSTIEAAVHFTLLTNQLEQQVLDANTILIYPNTAAKLKDYQEMVIKTFYLANADAKAVANTLKTIVKTRDVVTDDKLNLLIVRDSLEAIRLAEKLVALHDVPEPEVMLEVEILEVNRTRLLELGIRWPDSLALTPLPATTGGTLRLDDLRDINSSRLGAAIGPVTIRARQEDADANILANPRIRARNREKAKILIGERVPNITSTSTSTGFLSESINYVDVGLKLEVEPSIHLDNDVAIKISLEVSNIVNQIQTKSGSIAYQIGTRTASTVLRLKDGENQVLAGLINDEDRRAANKVPGIGELPVVGRLFGTNLDNNVKTEIVLSITPRLVRNIQRPEASSSEFKAGTENSLRARPESISSVNSSPTARTTSPAAVPGIPTALPGTEGTDNKAAGTTPAKDTAGSAPLPVSSGQLRWQGPVQAKVGDTIAMQLLMQSDDPITGLPMAVGFDNRALQVIGITEGDFLKQGGAQSTFTSRVDPNGQILMTGTRSGDGGATNSGTVATLSFRAIAPSAGSRIQLLTVAPVGVAGRSVAVPSAAPHTIQIQP